MNQNNLKLKTSPGYKKKRKKKRKRKKNKFNNRKSKLKNRMKKKIRKTSKFRIKKMKMKNTCILITFRRNKLTQRINKIKTSLMSSQMMKKSSSINLIDKIALRLVQTIVNIS